MIAEEIFKHCHTYPVPHTASQELPVGCTDALFLPFTKGT